MAIMAFFVLLILFSGNAHAATALSNGVAVNNIGGVQGSMQMFQITVPAGATNLSFTTSGGSGGDVDIFAKFNAQPTVTSYDAKSDGPTRNESISFATPQAGTYYLLMYGDWSTYAGVTLVASYTASASTSTVTLTNGVPVNNIGGVQGSMQYFTISVPSGATNLKFVTSGGSGGDVDIYVKLNQTASTTAYDWSGTGPTPAETIAITTPQAGTYSVLLYGDWSTYAGVTLTASYTPPSTAPAPTSSVTALTNGVAVNNIGGAQGSSNLYQITVPAGATNLTFTTSGGSGGDVDIYAKFNGLPTTTSYDAGSYGPTRNESITISTPQAGTYYLLLYGDWSTYAGVTLVASYTAPSTAPAPTGSVTTLTNGVAVNNIGGAQGSSNLYQITVPTGATNLTFTTSGGSGGDVDMYVKYSLPVSTTAYDWGSYGPTRNESITVSTPQAGTYNVLLYGDWSTYSGVSLKATYSVGTTAPAPAPTPQACYQSSSTVTPAIASQAAWDSKFATQYGGGLPNLSGDGEVFAWHGYYDVRAYVSMAKTYGDTKYMDYAVTTINYWFNHTDGGPLGQGWAYSYNPAQMMLDTGVIAQAIALFSFEAWNDSRFTAYRSQASSYIAKLEPMLHTYDPQWVTNAPFPGSPSGWVYATCGGICGPDSLVMYNQGAAMAKALLLIDRTYRLQGLTPDPNYLMKASAVAAYFKTFATQSGGAYVWSYGGAIPQGTEDIDHGSLDLSLLNAAAHYGLGGLTATDTSLLVGTLGKVLSNGNSDYYLIDGTTTPDSYYASSVGWDWIDLTDSDPTGSLFNKTVTLFNNYAVGNNPDGYFVGWAEILRKKNCVSLY